MQNPKIFTDHKIESSIKQGDYCSALKLLLTEQIKNWPQLSEVYSSLINVKTRSFRINKFKMKVQYNPSRFKSTSAKTDAVSIKSRECFLCIKNLPAEQLGINYHDKFIFLCNPFPIFPEHFTISSFGHQPQRLKLHFEEFLGLTKAVSHHYSIIYNGPHCGASAPDHLHFQAGTKNFLPTEYDIHQLKNAMGKIIYEDDKLVLTAINDAIRKIILIESSDEKVLTDSFNKFYDVYKSFDISTDEPMFNLISYYDDGAGWTIIVFLRSRHRPERYFREDNQKLLVSPAAVDLGGVLITPREKDFDSMNEEIISKIFEEVSLEKSTFLALYEKLKIVFNNN